MPKLIKSSYGYETPEVTRMLARCDKDIKLSKTVKNTYMADKAVRLANIKKFKRRSDERRILLQKNK